jgi:glycolate oxidase iron-sulfur subunit
MTPRPAAAHASLLDAADLCVKCGLCLPHCPTYGETRHEADSPRGRIALLQGLASDAITQTTTLEAHLDGCLSCRACERVCPAKVPYGQIIDAGRALLGENRPGRLSTDSVTRDDSSAPAMRVVRRRPGRFSPSSARPASMICP